MTARFGALDGRTLELSDGLNVLYAPNESGKSTWCAFLRTMLYGLDTAQRGRAGQKPDKLKYRPWSGAPMSGSMDVLTENGPVTLRRWTEREGRPMQAFSATVTGTETPAYGIEADTAGETLTGVTAAVFERSAFIRQAGIAVSNDPELDRRIRAIVSSGDETVSYLEAEKRLRSWQRHRRSGKRGAIPELRDELDGTRRTLDAIRENTRAAAEAEEELQALARRQSELEREMQAARATLRKNALAKLGAARKSVQAAEDAAAGAEKALRAAEDAVGATAFDGMAPEQAAAQAGTDRTRAEELRAEAERKLPVIHLYILAVLAAAFLAAGAAFRQPLSLGAGALLLLLFAWGYAGLRARKRQRTRLWEAREELLSRYGVRSPEEITALSEEYRALWEDKERAAFRLRTAEAALEERRLSQKQEEARAVNDLDFSAGDNEAARLGRELERVMARAAELRERRARIEGQTRALGDPVALESELAEGERRYTELLRQEEALDLALETLTRADGELQERLSPRLAKKAAEYFSFLTDGRYDEMTLTRDLDAKARRTGDAVGWDLDYLSAGAKDQLYLALRLAVCDLALPGEEPCPIVLDDALVAFDDERMARALELMRSVAEKRQVLLFSCHTRETEYFQGDPAVNKLTITD